MDTLRKEIESECPSVFPCLNDGLLESLELEKEGPGIMHLSTQEIERKFALLSIALKSDRESLGGRVKEAGRERTMDERKVDDIAHQIKANLSGMLVPGCSGSIIQIIRNIHKHLQVLQQSALRLAASAETAGAVNQENKVAYAVEVYMSHVEKLRNVQEKEKKELQEFRKILNKIESSEESSSVQEKRRNLSSIEISTSESQYEVDPAVSTLGGGVNSLGGGLSSSSTSSSTDNDNFFLNSTGVEDPCGANCAAENLEILHEQRTTPGHILTPSTTGLTSENQETSLHGNNARINSVELGWLAEIDWEGVDIRRLVDWLISAFIVSTLLYLTINHLTNN